MTTNDGGARGIDRTDLSRRAFLRRSILMGTAASLGGELLSACGGSSSSSSTSKVTASLKSGGDFVLVTQSVPDSIDPAIAFTGFIGYIAIRFTYAGLVSYNREAPGTDNQVVPVLAEALPALSADGLTYSCRLRPGARYSDGRPILASHFKYGIERLWRIASPGTSYFTALAGVPEYAAHKAPHIAGIVADDAAATLHFHLSTRSGTFLYTLATEWGIPIPPDVPLKPEEARPIPSAGPYYISSYVPNVQIVLTRNPHFNPVPGLPAGYPNRCLIKLQIPPADAASMLEGGTADWAMDGIAGNTNGYLTAAQIAAVNQRDPGTVHTNVAPSTNMIIMNATIPPFDNVDVRRAVNYALDRQALVKIFNGYGVPAYEMLPPSFAGYLGTSPYSGGRDLAKARALVKSAGAVGAPVTVNGQTDTPWPEVVTYIQSVLTDIGLNAQIRLLGAVPYFTLVQTTSTRFQIGHWNWASVVPDASGWFDVLVNGDNIAPSGNNVLSRLNSPTLNKAIRDADLTLDPKARTAAWQNVERQVTDLALFAPYMYERAVNVVSPRVRGFLYDLQDGGTMYWPASSVVS